MGTPILHCLTRAVSGIPGNSVLYQMYCADVYDIVLNVRVRAAFCLQNNFRFIHDRLLIEYVQYSETTQHTEIWQSVGGATRLQG